MADSRRYRQAVQYSTAGIELSLMVGLFLYGGYRLDTYLGLLPLFTLIGTFTGMAAGFYRIFRMITADEREKGDNPEKR